MCVVVCLRKPWKPKRLGAWIASVGVFECLEKDPLSTENDVLHLCSLFSFLPKVHTK
jgi:hypothetical protein